MPQLPDQIPAPSSKLGLYTLVVIGLCVVIVATVALIWLQPPILLNHGLGYDGRHYHNMTGQWLNGTVTYRPPWVNRFGIVWLTGMVSRCGQVTIRDAYWWVNIGATCLTVMTLIWAGLGLITRWSGAGNWHKSAVIVLPIAWWAWHWLSPFRFAAFDPYSPDFLAMWILLVGTLIYENGPTKRSNLVLLSILTLIGCLFREFVLILPTSILLSQWYVGKDKRQYSGPIIITVAGVIGLILARSLVTNTMSNGVGQAIWYHLRDIGYHLLEIRPLIFILSALLAYGPILVLLYVLGQYLIWTLRDKPYRWILIALMLILSYVGGTDTERYLYWISPILIYWCWLSLSNLDGLGSLKALASLDALARLRALPMMFWIVLIISQSVASRWWWPIPQAEPTDGFNWPILTSFGGTNPFLQLFGHHGYQLNYVYTLVLMVQYASLITLLIWLAKSKSPVHSNR